MLHICIHTSKFVTGQSAVLCTSNKYVHTEMRTKTMKNVRQAICYPTGTYFIKVEAAPVHDLKAHRRGEGIANVDIRWRCVVSLTLQHLRLRQTRLRYPLNKRMGWTSKNRSGRFVQHQFYMGMGETQASVD